MNIGNWNQLRIDRIKDVGAYLTDGREDVLLPSKQVPRDVEVGDTISVFVYLDSKDRPIATVNEPLITLGEIARLRVKSVADFGAFADFGLERDLFIPFKEQTCKVEAGKEYLFKLYLDKSGRLALTMRLYDDMLPNESYNKGDTVTGTVYDYKKGFGAFVAIDDKYAGLIHESEIFSRIYVGDTVTCRVIKRRDDGKTDLSMRREIHEQMNEDADMVYAVIKSYNGHLPFNDKADKELIKKEFGLSKNAFKRAVGHLLKEGKITIGEKSIDIKD